MICRRASKCEPLLRFNPLNLAKIACFAKWVKGAKCMCFLRFSKRIGVDDSDLYYFKDKGSIKITSKLEDLGLTLLSGTIGSILTKFAYFTSISGPHVVPKENSLKKIYGSEFLQSSFIFVIYLLKEVYRKIRSKSILWAKLDMRILMFMSSLEMII